MTQQQLRPRKQPPLHTCSRIAILKQTEVRLHCRGTVCWSKEEREKQNEFRCKSARCTLILMTLHANWRSEHFLLGLQIGHTAKKKKKKIAHLVLHVNVRMPLTCSCRRRCGVCEDRDRQELLHSVMFPCFPLLVALENCKSTCPPHLKSFLVSTALAVIRVLLLLFTKLFLLRW